ncbi:orexin/Hypocretin receptor type 1-like [Artemia franciscana]|uniref:orexin/Hypocretin receptor type 1-like n=1 Tax=Artemia franciscana TaxID=6661 RepID=UPI0032D9B552
MAGDVFHIHDELHVHFVNESRNLEDYMQDYHTMIYTYNEPRNIVLLILYVPTFLASVIMNTLVILTIVRYKHLRSVTNYFLVNLSIADLFVTLVCMPMAMGQSIFRFWIFGIFLCKFGAYLQGVSVSVSVFSILVMSIDRFWAISQPMRFRQVFNKAIARKVIFGIWLVASIIFIPILIVRKVVGPTIINKGGKFVFSDINVAYCIEKWPAYMSQQGYGIGLFFIIYLIPTLCVLVLYTSTGCKLFYSGSLKEGNDLGLDRDSRLLRTRRRAARTLMILAAVFSLCWLPYSLVNMILDSPSFDDFTKMSIVYIQQVAYFFSGNDLGLDRDSRLLRTRRRAARTLMILAAVFSLCWLPYSLVNMILDSPSFDDFTKMSIVYIQQFFVWFGHVNSAANPVLYSFLSVHFRSSLIKLIKRSKSCGEPKIWRMPNRFGRGSSAEVPSSYEARPFSPKKDWENQYAAYKKSESDKEDGNSVGLISMKTAVITIETGNSIEEEV